MVLSVKFFEGSNVAKCPTFEIKLFTLTVHNLSICYIISHISKEGEFSLEESGVIFQGHSSSFTLKKKQHKCHFFLHLKSDLH